MRCHQVSYPHSNICRHACNVRRTSQLAPGKCTPFSTPSLFKHVPTWVHTRPTYYQRRCFFEFLRRSEHQQQIKVPWIDPGWADIVKFRHHQTGGFRLPPDERILSAFRRLVQYKVENGLPVNSLQAFCCKEALLYLVRREDQSGSAIFASADLILAQKAFALPPEGEHKNHLAMIRLLHRLLAVDYCGDSTSSQRLPLTMDERYREMGRYLTCMSTYGGASLTADELFDFVKHEDLNPRRIQFLFLVVLGGIASNGNEQEVLSFMDRGQQALEIAIGSHIQYIMVSFYLNCGDRLKAAEWLDRPLQTGECHPRGETLAAILRFATQTGKNEDIQWGEAVLRRTHDITDGSSPLLWEVILQWAVLVEGSSLDKISRMIDTLQQRESKISSSNLNKLIRATLQKGAAVYAKQIFDQFSRLNIPFDAETYLLQLECCVLCQDYQGARSAYTAFSNMVSPANRHGFITQPLNLFHPCLAHKTGFAVKPVALVDYYEELDMPRPHSLLWTLPPLNQYIRFLCSSQAAERVREAVDVAQDIENSGLVPEATTLAYMCMAFLNKDMSFSVINALNAYAGQYSESDRKTITDVFVQYICNYKHSTARVWDAYQLVLQFFPELEKASRLQIMEEFFRRKRSDMACHVFGHMRQKEGALRPTSSDYVQVLEGLGKWPDQDSLLLVYNMLKLDTFVSYNTSLYNALMIAWATAGQPHKALVFWEHIQNSIEGPSYNSLAIVFHVLQGMTWGEKKADSLWKRLQDMEIDVPEHVWRGYVVALAAHGNEEKALHMLQHRQSTSEEISDNSFLVIYDAFAKNSRARDALQAWMETAMPEQWRQIKRHLTKPASQYKRAVRDALNLQA